MPGFSNEMETSQSRAAPITDAYQQRINHIQYMAEGQLYGVPLDGFSGLVVSGTNGQGNVKQQEYLKSVSTQVKQLDKPGTMQPELGTFSLKSQKVGRQASEVLGYKVLEKESSTILAEALRRLDIDILNQEQVDAYKLDCAKIAKAGDDGSAALVGSTGYWAQTLVEEYEKEIPEHVLNKAIQVKREVPEVEILVDEFTVVPDPFLVVRHGSESYFIEVWDEPKFEGRLTK